MGIGYDWIVVGAGFTGAALAYELKRQGFSVLLMDQFEHPLNASRFSYGGLAYWSGTSELTRQLCAEGMALHRSLPDELEADTQLREVDLLLTIAPTEDPAEVAERYGTFEIKPQPLSVAEACEREPLLNPAAISGALLLGHGHIDPPATVQAYLRAFERSGGIGCFERVTALKRGADRGVEVHCPSQTFYAAQVAVCAGAMSRSLLKASGIRVPIYFTHAEVVETLPAEIHLRSIVMPAVTERFELEASASRPEMDKLWDAPGHEPTPAILDAGAVQFRDRRICLGQLSRTLTDVQSSGDPAISEKQIRSAIGKILPALAELPGSWHRCQIAFSRDRLPLIGTLPESTDIHLFSGFSSPLVTAPALARRFAAHAAGASDPLLAELSPARFHSA